MKVSSKLDDAYKVLDRNINWISNADNKASILLAFSAVLFAGNAFLNDITNTVNNTEVSVVLRGLIWGIGSVYAISFLLVILYIFCVIKARVKSDTGDSVIYYGDISRLNMTAYKEQFKSKNDMDILDDVLNQVHVTSRIASKKYTYLNKVIVSVITNIIALTMLTILVQLATSK